MRVWRTAGEPQEAQTTTLDQLFHTGNDRLTDPRVLYDAPSDRWYMSISDVDSSKVLLAVSRSADPTGAWAVYPFAAGGCADQPHVGVSDTVVVVAADIFGNCDEASSPVLGSELWTINKQQLVAGATSIASTTFGPDHMLATMVPVQSLSPTETEYVVSVDNPSSRVVHLFAVDGTPPGAVHVQQVALLPIAMLSQPPNAEQPLASIPGRQPMIQTNDDRILDAVWENDKLWFSANSACIPTGDTTLRACGRIAELSTATRTLDWSTDLSQPGAYVFFPALRPDGAGNLVITYGESSQTERPQLVVVSRSPDGTLTPPTTIVQSLGPFLGDRYGDYFGAARDPSDAGVIWVAGETGASATSGRGWSTALAAVTATGDGAPPTVVQTQAPHLRAKPVVSRAGAPMRLRYTALDDGVGVRAAITVSRKSSVVFRTTTTPGTVHAGQVYSVLWRPAKKLRGAFRFCVGSIADDGTHSAQSCASVTLR